MNLFKGQKVKITRPINAHTVDAQYLPNGKAYELQTWYTDGVRRPVLSTSVVASRSKVKVEKLCYASDRSWPISREQSVLETPNLVGRLPVAHPRVIMSTSFKVKCQRSRSPGRLMLRHVRLERSTDFKLSTQKKNEDPTSAMTSKVKGQGRDVTWCV